MPKRRTSDSGDPMTATPVHPSGNAVSCPRGTIPTLAFAGSILISACSGGMAAGYYGYAQDISAGDPFVIWLWFILFPAGALALSWWPGKLLDWSSGALLVAPFTTLLGFWIVYRHPDLWTAGAFSATASVALCSAAFSLGRLFRRWRPQWMAKVRWLHWLISVLAVAYSITATALLVTPLNVEYELHARSYKGEGVLNGAATDVGIATGNLMYFCDEAVHNDLMISLLEHGYTGMPKPQGARKSLGGPLLKVLPIRDQGLLGK